MLLTIWAQIVTIVGLSMGLFGYDNSFAAPLISLPLFIEKYQGPEPAFTVCNQFPSLQVLTFQIQQQITLIQAYDRLETLI